MKWPAVAAAILAIVCIVPITLPKVLRNQERMQPNSSGSCHPEASKGDPAKSIRAEESVLPPRMPVAAGSQVKVRTRVPLNTHAATPAKHSEKLHPAESHKNYARQIQTRTGEQATQRFRDPARFQQPAEVAREEYSGELVNQPAPRWPIALLAQNKDLPSEIVTKSEHIMENIKMVADQFIAEEAEFPARQSLAQRIAAWNRAQRRADEQLRVWYGHGTWSALHNTAANMPWPGYIDINDNTRSTP